MLLKDALYKLWNVFGLSLIHILTGSMGYGNIEKLTDTLLNSADENTEIVILGGNNEKLKGRLRCKYSADFVKVIDFTDKVDVYMDACDIIFTKPGGLTSTEAAVKNIPIIHTDPIPGLSLIHILSATSPDFCKQSISVHDP